MVGVEYVPSSGPGTFSYAHVIYELTQIRKETEADRKGFFNLQSRYREKIVMGRPVYPHENPQLAAMLSILGTAQAEVMANAKKEDDKFFQTVYPLEKEES